MSMSSLAGCSGALLSASSSVHAGHAPGSAALASRQLLWNCRTCVVPVRRALAKTSVASEDDFDDADQDVKWTWPGFFRKAGGLAGS